MSYHLLPRTAVATSTRTAGLSLPRRTLVAGQVRFDSTTSTNSAKGPSKAESSPQGSDQRGKTTSYALPAVAATLALAAIAVRFSSKESKLNAIDVGVQRGGADKLNGSKAKGIEDAKANAQANSNIK